MLVWGKKNGNFSLVPSQMGQAGQVRQFIFIFHSSVFHFKWGCKWKIYFVMICGHIPCLSKLFLIAHKWTSKGITLVWHSTQWEEQASFMNFAFIACIECQTNVVQYYGTVSKQYFPYQSVHNFGVHFFYTCRLFESARKHYHSLYS